MDKIILEEKKAILSTDYIPKYEQLYIHPEEGERFAINDSFEDIYSDIKFIDSFLIKEAQDLNNLIISVAQRLDSIDLDIKSEQERLQDIKMLCNKFTDFDNVIPITGELVTSGEYSESNNTFYCAVDKKEKSMFDILDIAGNGVEGNKYVYKDYEYTKDNVDTSNRKFINDTSLTSLYEYERITASATEQYLIGDFNTDSESAKCTLTLRSKNKMNLLTITSDNDSLYIVGMQYSYDGVEYFPLEIPSIKINDKLASYDDYEYIYGDNKICIPSCYFVKITFQSCGTTDDALAYDRVMFSHLVPKSEEEKLEEDKEDGIVGGHIGATQVEDAPIYNEIEDATIIVKSAKRHVIKINDISAVSNKYKHSSHFKTGELIKDGKYYSVGLFLNAYIPSELDSSSAEFIFTINGEDYTVSPVNSELTGHKIFRYSQGKSSAAYTKLLDEPIKSLFLTVKLYGKTDCTPFIGNIKVLLGGDI